MDGIELLLFMQVLELLVNIKDRISSNRRTRRGRISRRMRRERTRRRRALKMRRTARSA